MIINMMMMLECLCGMWHSGSIAAFNTAKVCVVCWRVVALLMILETRGSWGPGIFEC